VQIDDRRGFSVAPQGNSEAVGAFLPGAAPRSFWASDSRASRFQQESRL